MSSNPPTARGGASRLSELPWASWILLIGCGVIALRPLVPTWDDNPNYSFGWWIPFLSIILIVDRWSARPPRETAGRFRLWPLLGGGSLLFLAFRLVAEADPDWRPGLWTLVGLYVAALLGWLWLYGGRSWLRYFAFPVFFLFLSLPWFFEIEYPLVQGLMRWNTGLVAHSLRDIGISAEPVGNIIQLQNCQLGVEEACSGILSLQASLMMGFLLGEIYRLSVRRRLVLVMTSLSLALMGNYLRTFFLALMAFYSGPDAVPRWHDTAGYAILAFTAIGSWLAALSLGTRTAFPGVSAGAVSALPADEAVKIRQAQSAWRFALVILAVAVLAEAGTQAWFGWRELSLVRHPEWIVRMPATESFQPITLSEVTLAALRCDVYKAGQWQDGHGWNWTAYWLRYDPKPYTRIVLGWHTPDNCLPSIGLIKDRDYPEFMAEVNGLHFYVQPKKFLAKDAPIYLFWIVYPNSGERPPDTDTRITPPFASKLRIHSQDVWNGNRGVGVETLEIALAGPQSYDEAKAGFLAGLQTLAMPGSL